MWNTANSASWQKSARRPGGRFPSLLKILVPVLILTLVGLLVISQYLTSEKPPVQLKGLQNQDRSNFKPITPIIHREPVAPILSPAAVIVSNAYQFIPSPIFGDDNRMFYTYGGNMPPYFLLTHELTKGASAKQSWQHLFESLMQVGTFFAVDMINYGNSSPGPTNMKRFIDKDEHARIFSTFIDLVLREHGRPATEVIMFAKGQEVSLIFSTISNMQHKIKGLVLIAPENVVVMPKRLKDVPAFIVWGKDDPISTFEKSAAFVDYFSHPKTQTLFFEEVVGPGVSKKEAHHPDRARIDDFNLALHKWVKSL